MPITPEEVRNKEFSVTLRRGYEKDQVDEFLALLAEDYQNALSGSASSGDPFAEMGQRVAEILRTAETAAADVRKQADEEGVTFRKRAADKALAIRRQGQEEAEKMVASARAEADTILSEARSLAARLKEEAEQTAQRVRQAAAEERDRLLGDAAGLNERLVAYEKDLRERVRLADEALDMIKSEFLSVDAARDGTAPTPQNQRPGSDGRSTLEQAPA